jgi:hypothetical protein
MRCVTGERHLHVTDCLKRLYQNPTAPLSVSNHRIGSSVGFSGVLEIDARLERIRGHYLVVTSSTLSGKIC